MVSCQWLTVIYTIILVTCRPRPATSKADAISEARYTHVTIQSCGFSTIRRDHGSPKESVALASLESDTAARESDAEPGASAVESDTFVRASTDTSTNASTIKADASQSTGASTKDSDKESNLALPCIQCEHFTFHKIVIFKIVYSCSIPDCASI